LKRHTHKAYLNALMTLDINERRCKMLKKWCKVMQVGGGATRDSQIINY
jgi:hypothetical protein